MASLSESEELPPPQQQQDSLLDFSSFVLDQVLDQDLSSKKIILLGSFRGKEGQAIVSLSQKAFDTPTISSFLNSSSLSLVFINDIYGVYDLFPPPLQNPVKAHVIYPCTKAHIAKYTQQEFYSIRETKEMYEKVTQPFIESFPPERTLWVHNLINKSAEAERLLTEDEDDKTGFVMHPDMKWDLENIKNLHCIAISRKAIPSLRHLTGEHIPLLKNIFQKGVDHLVERFGVEGDQLLIYLHYQPSYYHLHVHFSHVHYDVSGTKVGKAHLLLDVIDSLERDPSYYQKVSLTYTLPSLHPLCVAFLGEKLKKNEKEMKDEKGTKNEKEKDEQN